MHYYEYHQKSSETEKKTKEKYPWLFEWDYSLESIEVRYHLLEYLHREYWYSGILEKDENGKPIPIYIVSSVLLWLKVPKILLWLIHFGIYFRFIFGIWKTLPLSGIKQFQISPKISSIDTQNSPNKEANGKQETKKWTLLYWSVSHSSNYVSFILSDEPTGIDIAEYEERDVSLFDMHSDSEYDLLGGKSWINFYILWTAKESIIKCIGWQLDDMKYIVCTHKQSEMISLFAFREKTYRIQTSLVHPLIISYII